MFAGSSQSFSRLARDGAPGAVRRPPTNTGNDRFLQLLLKDFWVRSRFRKLSSFLRFYSRPQLSKLQRSLFNERSKSFTQTCCFQGQRIEAQECFHDNIADNYISEIGNKKKNKVQQRKLLAARYKIPCKSTKRRVQKLAARSAVKNGVK